MVGALNKLPIALSGLVFFNAPITVPSVSAIGVGFVSGIVYTISKLREVEQNKKKGSGAILPTEKQVVASASSQSLKDGFKS